MKEVVPFGALLFKTIFMLKQQVIGHLGKDAEANTVNGKQVINFNVAHSKTYTRGDGQKITETIWISCAWWTDSQKILPWLKKGQQVYVCGEPNVRIWRDSQGQPNASMTLRVEELQLCGSAPNQNQASYSAQQPSSQTTQESNVNDDVADDLPF